MPGSVIGVSLRHIRCRHMLGLIVGKMEAAGPLDAVTVQSASAGASGCPSAHRASTEHPPTRQPPPAALIRGCSRRRFLGVPTRKIEWRRTAANLPTRTHKPRVAGSIPAAARFSPSGRQISGGIGVRESARPATSIHRCIHCAKNRLHARVINNYENCRWLDLRKLESGFDLTAVMP